MIVGQGGHISGLSMTNSIPIFQQEYPVFASLFNGDLLPPYTATLKKLTTSTEATINPPEPVYLNDSSGSSRLPNEDLNTETILRNYTTNVTIVGPVYELKN